MALPKMVLFDYGETLVHEDDFDAVAGNEALLRFARQNPEHVTALQLQEFVQKLQEDTLRHARTLNLEAHNRIFNRFLFEYFGLELALTPLQAETIFWDAAAPGSPMPGICELLEFLHCRGIRTGVVSNISFSGEALAERVNRLLPGNHFEFIIASSEYLFRKPSPRLFGIALRKAGVAPGNIWFCGDNAAADVSGASAAGMWPVWYTAPLPCAYRPKEACQTPDCACAHIFHWRELQQLLQEAQRADCRNGCTALQ